MSLSICIITFNEEVNIRRTLESVKDFADEIIIVDSGSTDTTTTIAQSFGARVYAEPWKGFAAQKNSALAKASGDWILSLDADEEVIRELAASIKAVFQQGAKPAFDAYTMNRRNLYLGRWIRHSGYYPDPKMRLVRRELAEFELRAVHEDMKKLPRTGHLDGDLLHHAYPTLQDFIEHANRYSSLGAEMVVAERKAAFSVINIVLRPLLRFIYMYFFRLGFLDGREGLLVLMTHASYVSWKYAKAWELSRRIGSPHASTSNTGAPGAKSL